MGAVLGISAREQLLLPDGVTSAGAAQEEVVLALRHDHVGALHGRQLGRIWGVPRGWGLRGNRIDHQFNHSPSPQRKILRELLA